MTLQVVNIIFFIFVAFLHHRIFSNEVRNDSDEDSQKCAEINIRFGKIEFNTEKGVSFTCMENFKLTGAPDLFCVNKTWSSPAPTCSYVCDKIDLKNGKVEWIESENIAKFSCYNGFFLHGSTSAACEDEIWSEDTPACIPQEYENSPDDYPETCKPYENGGEITMDRNNNTVSQKFTCDESHILIGSEEAECKYGQWTLPPGRCIDEEVPFYSTNGYYIRYINDEGILVITYLEKN